MNRRRRINGGGEAATSPHAPDLNNPSLNDQKLASSFFFERSGQLPACINKEKAFYMKNLLRNVLNRMIGTEQMTFRIGSSFNQFLR